MKFTLIFYAVILILIGYLIYKTCKKESYTVRHISRRRNSTNHSDKFRGHRYDRKHKRNND
jgi:hypothetical protein